MPIKDSGFDRTLHLDRYPHPQHHLNSSPNVLLPSLPAFALHLFQMLCSAMHPRGRLQTSFSLGPFSLLSSGPKQNPGAGQHRRRGRNRHGARSLTGTPCETMQPTFDKLTHGLALAIDGAAVFYRVEQSPSPGVHSFSVNLLTCPVKPPSWKPWFAMDVLWGSATLGGCLGPR